MLLHAVFPRVLHTVLYTYYILCYLVPTELYTYINPSGGTLPSKEGQLPKAKPILKSVLGNFFSRKSGGGGGGDLVGVPEVCQPVFSRSLVPGRPLPTRFLGLFAFKVQVLFGISGWYPSIGVNNENAG